MLDRYWSGNSNRISPEAPVPVIKIAEHKTILGGAANVAANLRTLGAKVLLLGMIGKDDMGKQCQQLLDEADIVDHCQKIKGLPTISKLRIISNNQQMLRIDHEESYVDIDKTDLQCKFSKLLDKADLVILSDYNKGTLTDTQFYIETAKKNNKPILVDPKGDDFSKYRGATLITPNSNEFTNIKGNVSNQEELYFKAEELRQELQLEALLVTQGAKGMSLIVENKIYHEPSYSNEVVDVTGAGDTVLATLAFILASGKPLQHAMQMANTAASVVVSKANTAQVSMEELLNAFHNTHPHKTGILNLEELQNIVAQEKLCGSKIVFTNGCFDILHAGHVTYLEKTKALGDKLIVAVNSDSSIKKLKGEGRPYSPEKSRLKVMAALKCVDWVIVFDDDTPLRLIEALQPDVLAKGGDYKIENIVGADFVQENGGEVVVVHHEHNDINSSSILNKMRDN